MNKINKEIGFRISQARKKMGITAVELSQRTGFSSARISHWEQGRRLPNLDSILVLQEMLRVPAAHLLCMDIDQSIPEKNNSIPLYKITELTNETPFDTITVSIPVDLDYKQLFAIKVFDDSMLGLYRKDDIVVFHRNKELVDGAFVLLLIKKTGQALFRKFIIGEVDIFCLVCTRHNNIG